MKNLLRALAASMLALAVAPATTPADAQAQAPYAIVVSASNPITSLSREQASKLFLKKTPTWADGREVVPVDLPEGSAVREAFTKSVLHKSVSAVKSYWQQQIFSGRDIPPPEKQTENDVVAFVRSNPGAIGYVSKGVDIGRGVKALSVAP